MMIMMMMIDVFIIPGIVENSTTIDGEVDDYYC